MIVSDTRVAANLKEVSGISMNNSIVFTHNDLDGIGAGEILYKQGAGEIIICSYSKNEVKDHLDKTSGKVVFITDFSMKSVAEFDKLFSTNPKKVIWFDHHKSIFPVAVKLCEKYSKWIASKRLIIDVDMERSGALITADALLKKTHPFYRVCEYIDDHDRWIHKLDSIYLNQYIMDGCNCYVGSSSMEALWILESSLDSYIECGKKLFNIQMEKNKLLNSTFGYDTEFKGYTARVIEQAVGNSSLFGDDFYKYDLCIILRRKDGLWAFSMYTTNDNIDCSALCSEFGGGGHAKAAGGTSITRPF